MRGRVESINVNPKGGVPKHRVASAAIHANGVAGDKQRDLRYHGGPTRAVSLYSLELIDALRTEGHPISPGTTGENLTISGLEWETIGPGDLFRVGDEVLLEITKFAGPCKHIRASFEDEEFTRISAKLHPGWSRLYARVVEEGTVREGDEVTVTKAEVAAG
jgi:MOSC domain-containing protein YiiM